jgi:hypothetical protein
MPETHVPRLKDDEKPHTPAPAGTRPARGKSLLKIGLEVALIRQIDRALGD